MNKERLQEALNFARENGLPSITVDGITMPVPKVQAPQRELTEEEMKKLYPPEEVPTDEEILFWSSPYYDELQMKKEMQKQAQKEKENLNG